MRCAVSISIEYKMIITLKNKLKYFNSIFSRYTQKLNVLRKGSKCFECSDRQFNERYIEWIKGKLFLLCDQKNILIPV